MPKIKGEYSSKANGEKRVFDQDDVRAKDEEKAIRALDKEKTTSEPDVT